MSTKKVELTPSTQIKRPRGRPPLSGNKRKASDGMMLMPTIQNHPIPNKPYTTIQSANAQHNKTVQTHSTTSLKEPKHTHINKQHTHSHHTFTNLLNDPTTTDTKTTRINYPIHKIFTHLLIDDPISLNTLHTLFPDIPKDVISTALEVLQVLGFVSRLKSTTLSGSESTVYTIKGNNKGTEAVDMNKISHIIHEKLDNINRIKARIAALEVGYNYDPLRL